MLILTCEICGGFIDAVRIPSLECPSTGGTARRNMPVLRGGERMKKPDCYKCVYRKDIAGDAHSCCVHPDTGLAKSKFPEFEGLTAILGIGKSSSASIKWKSRAIRTVLEAVGLCGLEILTLYGLKIVMDLNPKRRWKMGKWKHTPGPWTAEKSGFDDGYAVQWTADAAADRLDKRTARCRTSCEFWQLSIEARMTDC